MIQTVGLVGYGHFGVFLKALAERYAPNLTLKVYSRSNAEDGLLFFPLEEVAACDAVVLTVPISAYEDNLLMLKPHLRDDTILVDVATVKVFTTDIIRAVAPGHRFIAMHPMFGPESYTKRHGDVAGLRIVITDDALEEGQCQALISRLREIGFSVVETSADNHDRDLAETLFLTHYVGQVVAHGNFERTDIDSVSFGYLMDAVDSVRHDTKLFEDVFRFNPYCRKVVERFDRSERHVKERLLGYLEDRS